MKLLIVIPSFYPALVYGGTVFTSYNTCNELAKFGIDFKVVTTNANGNNRLKVIPNIFLSDFGYPVKYYNETIISKFSIKLFRNIKLEIENADIIHIQGFFSTPTPIALYWAQRFKKKVLLTPHGVLGRWCLVQKKFIFKKLWIKYLIKPLVKNIVWHATAESEKLEILSIFPNANVIVIPNGIYLSEFSKYNRLTPDEFVFKFSNIKMAASQIIISAGRLQRKKGFDILIKAFHKILEKQNNLILFIAGEDEGELVNLKNIAIVEGISNRVFFTGMLTGQNRVDFFANADLFVLPSHNENFGLVYAEALAAGTPIVASTNTPWEEVETAGCGRWVPNMIDDTANAILDLLSRDREQLRHKAINYVHKFDWSNIANQFVNLYNNIE